MAPYFTKDETSTIKSVFDNIKEDKILKFSVNEKSSDRLVNLKNVQTWSSLLSTGCKMNEIGKMISNGNLTIKIKGDDGKTINAILKSAKIRFDNEKKEQEIVKDKLKAIKAIQKAMDRNDKIVATKVAKDAMKNLKQYEKDVKKGLAVHKKSIKPILKTVKKVAKEMMKNAEKKAKLAKKEQKEAEKEAKKAEKAAKKAEKEAKKAEKDAKKEEKEAQNSAENEANENQVISSDSDNNTEESESVSDSSNEEGMSLEDKQEYILKIKKLKIPELKDELNKIGCSNHKGKKSELIDRLIALV